MSHSKTPVTEADFKPIPPDKLVKPTIGRQLKVHVEGMYRGAVYLYEDTVKGVHQLRTPKTGKVLHTTSRLFYLREK